MGFAGDLAETSFDNCGGALRTPAAGFWEVVRQSGGWPKIGDRLPQ